MFFDSVLNNSKHILNYASTNTQTISGNISNLNNPNYKRKYLGDIMFENELANDNMKTTNENHITTAISNSDIKVYTDTSLGRNDENNVNLDKEIIDLTKSNYLFKAASEVVTTQYKMITASLE